jgi:hypothetical protein
LLLALFCLLAAPAATSDTTSFADVQTEALIHRAMVRHGASDQEIRDYQARFRYRLSFGLGHRRWSRVPNAAVEEQEGTVQWAAPNDLRVDIVGRRASARSSDLRLTSNFDRPWFIPRSLTDSIRVFGNEIPPRAAVHPLAANGAEWYRYRLTDSLQFSSQGRQVKLLGVEVLPRRNGPSLVAGKLWLDDATSELVRFSFRFVGTELWLGMDDEEGDKGDSKTDRRVNRLVSRILTLDADLEYSLQDGTHWMPYRQVVSGRVELPWFGELVIPFEARTTFDDYHVNSGTPVVFRLPPPPKVTDPDSIQALARVRRDSLREDGRRRRRAGGELPEDEQPRDDAGRWADGRFEIHRAAGDSLRAYAEWGDSLEFSNDPVGDREIREVQADLERLAVGLPPELTGRPTHGFSWDRLTDAMRYNRVQGSAPGASYVLTVPGDGFTTLRGEARFGFSDHRLTGALTLRREAPGARWTLSAYRDLRSNDPLGRGNGFGNSLNAIVVGHDDADYHLAHGARLTREGALGLGLELTTTLYVEREASVRREAHSWLNDAIGGTGDFPANPPVTDGTYGGAQVRLDGGLLRSRWSLAADVLANSSRGTARVYGSYRLPLWREGGIAMLALHAGTATASPLPQQAFRIGGMGTVRGFDYGTRAGQGFWSAQLDWPLSRGIVQPVLFADAGQAARTRELFGSRTIAGGGIGLAVLGGLLRFDLSHPITTGGHGLRFDFGARGLF